MFRKLILYFLFLPLFLIPLDFNKVSDVEKRILVNFNLNNFSSFFNDHFPYREELISSYIYLNHLAGVSVHPNLFIGNDGLLFLKTQDNITKKQRNIIYLDYSNQENIKNSLKKIYDYAEKEGILLYFAAIPDQQTVHYTKLPKWHTKLNDQDKFDQMKKIFTEIGYENNFIDLRNSLIKFNKKNSPTYHLYESHWTNYGSMIASKEILNHLNINDKNTYLFKETSFVWPDLKLREYVLDVNIKNLENFNKQLLLEDKHEKYFRYSSKNVLSNDNLMIYGDSFTLENSNLPLYMINNFSSVSRVSSNHQALSKPLIKLVNPSIILICVAERNFFDEVLFSSLKNNLIN